MLGTGTFIVYLIETIDSRAKRKNSIVKVIKLIIRMIQNKILLTLIAN